MSPEEIKKFERKIYLRCAIAIIIGAVMVAGGFKLKGIVASILVIGGFLVIIVTLKVFSNYFDIFYKAKGALREAETGEEFKETYINWPPWVKKWGGLLFAIIIFAGFGIFGRMHENDFGGLKFLWHSIIGGFITGLILFSILKLKFVHWTESRNRSIEIAFYVILASLFVFVCLGPLINKHFAKGPVTCREFKLKPGYHDKKKKSKYLHVHTEKGAERFQPHGSFIRKLSPGDSTVILCIRKGALGYEYVEEFKIP